MESYGFISILPPLIAVILAIKTKNVISALFWAGLFGALALNGWNPVFALQNFIKDFIFVQASDAYNSNLLVMMIFIGGFVGVLTHSGGAPVFANKIASYINTRTKAQLLVWFGGIIIFFSDSGNPLILGPSFQPVTDKLRISREKLAWLLDSTSSPVCILIPFIGWGVYILGLMQKEFEAASITMDTLTAFMHVLPFQFYAIGALFLIPVIAFTGYEFSAMYKAEKRTIETGQPFWPDAKPVRLSVDINEVHKGATLSMMVVPLIVLFICIFGLFIYHGFPFKRLPGGILRATLCFSYFTAAISCMLLTIKNKVKTPSECFKMYMDGAKEVVLILMILVLAWSLGSVCKALGTANYIVGLAQGTVPGWAVPALLFITGAGISFATGSSWGTFAILMPLAVPMSVALGAPLFATIGSVLSGGLFGDHCSPISDTTVLSSMGAACDHLDHVKTQLPYAMTVGLASVICYTIAGFIDTPLLVVLLMALVLTFGVLFSKKWGEKLSNKIELQ
ncbi:MAG: sodium:proton exchanger [Synergistaceae bacterium]|nr:sodium:proton exchanger [Synergistaceae bacterium]